MLQFFKRKKTSQGRVGLSLPADQVAMVHMEERGGVPHLLQHGWKDLTSEKEAGKAIGQLVKQLGVEGEQVSVVLGPRDYNLHLVEAPEVEDEELRSAIRWKVKDLLDMKIDDAAIDLFKVPADAYRGREMVYVVATRKSRVRHVVELLEGSGLELAVIDIPELVMKNITTRFVNDDHGVAFMDLRRTGSTMNISREGNLYLTRRINTQLDPDVMQAPDWDQMKDRLVLEIQRSLDYYESQMGKGQITQIIIAPRQQDSDAMASALDDLLAARVESLNLRGFMQSGQDFDSKAQQICLAAVGATLRGASVEKRVEKQEMVADEEEGTELVMAAR